MQIELTDKERKHLFNDLVTQIIKNMERYGVEFRNVKNAQISFIILCKIAITNKHHTTIKNLVKSYPNEFEKIFDEIIRIYPLA